MRLSLLLFCILTFTASLCVQAATPSEPAWRTVTGSINFPWQEGMSITIGVDENQCRKKYGAKWRLKCSAPLGRPGDTVKGVKLTPAASGYWQWRDTETIVFIPENGQSIKPDTAYTVNLENLPRPSFVKLAKNSLSLHSLPLCARLLDSNFWINPVPGGSHRLSASLQFNYPVPAGNFSCDLSGPAGAVFGKPEMVWNTERDQLNMSWPVKNLPATAGQAQLIFKNMGQVALIDGDLRYWPPATNGKGTTFLQNIPGKKDIFVVKNSAISVKTDENLDKYHSLELETSLYAKADDVLKHLEVWELPKYNSPEGIIPYDWSRSPSISQDVLKKSKKLTPALTIPENGATGKFSFAIPAENGSYILAALRADLKSANGENTLGQPWARIFPMENDTAALGFMQPGNVLPLAANAVLDIYSTDLDQIDWEVQAVSEPFLALMAATSPTPFQTPLSWGGVGMDNVSSRTSGSMLLKKEKAGTAQFSSLDLGEALEKLSGNGKNSGLCLVTLKGLRKGEQKSFVSRLILATDLGIIVKKSKQGTLDCFVSGLNDGKPRKNVRVSILGANGQPVANRDTDELGHAFFPSLSGLAREARPVAALAFSDGSLAWLPLEDSTRQLNFSSFPTGGNHVDSKGMNVFAFSRQGIFRPGDKLDFGCVARMANMAVLPENIPLYAEIVDPRGNRVWEKIFDSGKYGLAELSWQSSADILSGRYDFNILTGKNGAMLATVSVLVEAFQPDTLKMKIVPPVLNGWLHAPLSAGNNASISFTLNNLYGQPAANHRIGSRLTTAPAIFTFAGYEDFTFTDATPFTGNGLDRKLPPVVTNVDGIAELSVPAELLGHSSAQITISAEGFEAGGGRATVAQTSFMASPMDAILGYRPTAALTNFNYIPQNDPATLEFIALDPHLKKLSWPGLSFTVSERRYVTSLISDANGGFRYDETPVSQPVKTWKQDLPADGMKVSLETCVPGEFLLTIENEKGIRIAEIPYAVAGQRAEPPNTPLASGKMRVRLEKNAYAAGDTINLAIATPYKGSGLITLEREGVEAFTWFEAEAGDNVASIKIPGNFEGKGYVVVSFTRSPLSDAIYMEPHTFAAAPFTANVSARNMELALAAEKTAKPGETLSVRVSAKQPGLAAVYVVDEGILQLTGYRLPSPLASLLENRALDTATIQAYDLLMPEHGRLQPRLSAFGGGMAGAPFGSRFQNPFKRRDEPPVAFWAGIMQVGPQPCEVKIDIPAYYNGRLRLMAVGVSENGAGSCAAATTVAAPLVLSPQMPLAVSPGDEFTGALAIANTTNRDINGHLKIIVSDELKVIDMPEDTYGLKAGEEKTFWIHMKAGATPAVASINFMAVSGEEKFERSTEISIRPGGPMRTSLQAGIAKQSANIPVTRKVYELNAKSVASLSALPLPLIRNFAQYLDSYPYGCTEQLVSRAFAQVLLRDWPQLAVNEKDRKKLFESTLGAIRGRFNGSGVGLWPNDSENFPLTVYCADFLLTMRQGGLGAPNDLLEQLCDAIAANCSLNDSDLAAARNCAYAIWVLTREGRITTQLIESLLDALKERDVTGWENDLTAVFVAASQKEMHMRQTVSFADIKFTSSGWFDEYAQYAMYLALLSRYFPEKCQDSDKNSFYEATLLNMNENSYATFSANQGIRALLAVGGRSAAAIADAHMACEDNGGDSELLANGELLNYSTKQCQNYKLVMPKDSPSLFWQIATTGYDMAPASTKVARGIEVAREYLDSAGNPAGTALQGNEITVRITARATHPQLNDCIITDMLPGGFEMIIPGKAENISLPEKIKFIDRLEDRMLIFADLTNEPLVFTYKIRPVTPGTFLVPPVTAEAMYDQSQYGHGAAGTMEIKRQ